jgi:hypothetical protein
MCVLVVVLLRRNTIQKIIIVKSTFNFCLRKLHEFIDAYSFTKKQEVLSKFALTIIFFKKIFFIFYKKLIITCFNMSNGFRELNNQIALVG